MTRKLATVAGAPVVESQSRLTGSRCLCAGLATASFPQQPCSALQMLESGPLARRGRVTGLAMGIVARCRKANSYHQMDRLIECNQRKEITYVN